MHLRTETIIAALIVLTALSSLSQQSDRSAGQPHDQPSHEIMAKISYSSGTASDRGVRQICFSVARDGEYRMLASMSNGSIEVAHGTLAQEKFNELAKLISAPSLRSLTHDEPGLIRQDAEAFAAEIRLGKTYENGAREWLARPWRLGWLNPDGQRPFPEPVSDVVDWVKHLQPKIAEVGPDSAESGEYADVCPALGFRLVQPSLAER